MVQSSASSRGSALIYGLPPFIPAGCRILILGSMPSVASLEAGFYYAHPRNRFFRIIADFTGRELPDTASRKQALSELGIGLFDVIRSCRREGSLDSAIIDVTPNDLRGILHSHPEIALIATNGALARRLFLKHIGKDQEILGKISLCHLPSTSPANAAYSLPRLEEEYFRILAHACT